MRIITGKLKGRVIHPPVKKWPTRPTTDRMRESLFNILENRVLWEEVDGLDLFGGTGMISFEMISRGVHTVHYVDEYGPAVNFVRQTAKTLNVSENIKVFQRDVFHFLKETEDQYDIIFADPPYQLYGSRDLPDLILDNGLLADNGLLIIEHDKSVVYEEAPSFVESREYGQSLLSFFK